MGINESLLSISYVSGDVSSCSDLHDILCKMTLCVETITPQDILKRDTNESSVIVIDGYALGYEALALCKRLRLSGVKKPIALAWRHNSELDRAGCCEFGADVVVSRPFTEEKILSIILALETRSLEASAFILDFVRRTPGESTSLHPQTHSITC